MRRIAILLLVFSLLGTWAGGAAARGTTLDESLPSRALGTPLHFAVYLPPGYATSGLRYPVVYFLHGLPADDRAYRGIGFLARALDALGGKAILVAPQGARPGDTDPEYLDRGPGRSWETALSDELTRAVDSRFRTIRSRAGRAIVGLSAGGYGAMHIGLSHLRDYSAVESWSGYFRPTNPAGTNVIDLGSDGENARADSHRQATRNRALLRVLPTLVAFYVGRDDGRFLAENRLLNRDLTQLGVPHVFRIYPGGHSQGLWAAHAREWLGLALRQLASPRA